MSKKQTSPYFDSGKAASAAAILLICQIVLNCIPVWFFWQVKPNFRLYLQSNPFFLLLLYFQLVMVVILLCKKRGILLTLALVGYIGIQFLMVSHSIFLSGMYFMRKLFENGRKVFQDTFLMYNFVMQFFSMFRYIVFFFYAVRLSLRDEDKWNQKSRARWIMPGLLTAVCNSLGMIGLYYYEVYRVEGRVFSLSNISTIANSTAFLISVFLLCYFVAYPDRMEKNPSGLSADHEI